MARGRTFRRHRLGEIPSLIDKLVRDAYSKSPRPLDFTYDSTVEEFVERAAEVCFTPSAYVAKSIVREPRSDARGDLSSSAGLLRKRMRDGLPRASANSP